MDTNWIISGFLVDSGLFRATSAQHACNSVRCSLGYSTSIKHRRAIHMQGVQDHSRVGYSCCNSQSHSNPGEHDNGCQKQARPATNKLAHYREREQGNVLCCGVVQRWFVKVAVIFETQYRHRKPNNSSKGELVEEQCGDCSIKPGHTSTPNKTDAQPVRFGDLFKRSNGDVNVFLVQQVGQLDAVNPCSLGKRLDRLVTLNGLPDLLKELAVHIGHDRGPRKTDLTPSSRTTTRIRQLKNARRRWQSSIAGEVQGRHTLARRHP